MPDTIRLSTKEVSGLAARVFTSAFLPWGAIGAASEAIEFLELTGANGLSGLDLEKDDLLKAQWKAPDILEEGDGYAVCHAGLSPAPFYCAVLADWLAALVTERCSAVLALKGGLLHRYLGAVPYFMAKRGYSGIVLDRSDGGTALSAVVTSGSSWRYARIPSIATNALPMPRGVPDRIGEDAHILLFGFAKGGIEVDPLSLATEDGFEMSAAEYAEIKADVLTQGWQINANLWSSLMQFADRSLIGASERSRLGAG